MRIIIVGCGRLGSSLAQTLSLRGHTITTIDNDPSVFSRLGAAFTGSAIAGNGLQQDVLMSAGIDSADSLAAVTLNDETNVVIARLAREIFRVPKVVARTYDPLKAEVYWRLGVQTVCPSLLSAQVFADLLTFSRIETVMNLDSGEVRITRIEIQPALVGRAVKEITIPGEIQAIAIIRSGSSFIPMPTSVFQENDVVYLSVLATAAQKLQGMLGMI
jgi:trk system potassium uptake protein